MSDDDVVACFAACFGHTQNTILLGGGDEPLYRPAVDNQPARIIYRHDYAASALHEVAHWCIASTARRLLEDFGYVYLAPPRAPAEQRRFMALETRTQALESLFAAAADIEFAVSLDNLDGEPDTVELQRLSFVSRVTQARPEMQRWVAATPDDRARTFLAALQCRAGCSEPGP